MKRSCDWLHAINGKPASIFCVRSHVLLLCLFVAGQGVIPAQTHTLAAAFTGKPLTGTVDTGKTHQEIAGFGASEAYYQNFLAKNPHSKDIYDALFGPENGLHTDFLRLQNTFRYALNAGFDDDTRAIVQNANALRPSPMTVIMSSWSPPARLKSNGSEKNGGTLIRKNGKYDYADFAQYWQDSIKVYRALGIDPTYISIQNEPDETTDYESCRFNPNESVYGGDLFAGYAQAADAVYAAMQQLPNPPHLIGPETIGIGFGHAQAFTDAANPKDFAAVAYHLYTGGEKADPDTYIPALQAIQADSSGRVRFFTENYTETGFLTALMIEDSLVAADAGMYLNWPYAWPDESALIQVEDPGDPSKWKNKDGWKFNDAYFAMKQFSYFIHAHYRRVDATASNGDVKISAYLSPARDKLVVVAINPSAKEARQIKLRLGEFDTGAAVVYRTTFPATTERFAKLGPLGADRVLLLPPQSVATVEVQR